MKNKIKTISIMLLLVVFLASATSCGDKTITADPWNDAIYTENTEFGSGDICVTVEVKAIDRSVEFTINTDMEFLGEALLEHDLIEGEAGAYGLYVKKVNGITADYDVDQSYWSLKKDGEMMMVGVDGAEIANGEHYELEYTK